MRAVTLTCLGLLAQALPIANSFGANPASAQPTFERDIRPILRTHCFDCHGATQEKEANLDLRLVRFQLQGGDSGPATHGARTWRSALRLGPISGTSSTPRSRGA